MTEFTHPYFTPRPLADLDEEAEAEETLARWAAQDALRAARRSARRAAALAWLARWSWAVLLAVSLAAVGVNVTLMAGLSGLDPAPAALALALPVPLPSGVAR